MPITTPRPWLAALAAASLLGLSACGSSSDDANDSTEVADESLATMVAGADDFSTVAAALKDAGLSEVFDGAAPYTILAPTDAAFEQLGDAGKELTSAEMRPAMIAVLRDHILPGFLTRDDIAAAIAQADDGKVEMTTMGEGVLTFTDEDGTIIVTGSDGSSAHLLEGEMNARNGVLIPLDGVLKKVGP